MSTDEAIPQEAYGEAIAKPESGFADHRLRVMEPAIDPERGAPVVTRGRYAASYRLIDPFWVSPPLAVRCYLQQPPDLVGRYRALAGYLGDRTRSFPGLVPMELIEKGIQVRIGAIGRTWEPIVVHPWVPGRRLDVVVREAIANGSAGHVLPALRERLVTLARFLEEAGIAHGDVEPANLIVGEDGGLTLVDADGMVVPALAGRPTVEELTPHWRHPRRPDRADLALDRFPFIVLWVTLLVLERAPELLAGRPEAPDGRLLFLADDLAAPERSLLFTRTERIAGASGWTHALGELARGDYAAVPALAAFAALPITDRPAPEAVAWPVTDHRVEVDAGANADADAGGGVDAGAAVDTGGADETADGVAGGVGMAADLGTDQAAEPDAAAGTVVDPWTGAVVGGAVTTGHPMTDAAELPDAGAEVDPWTGAVVGGADPDADAATGSGDPWVTAEPSADAAAPDPWVSEASETSDTDVMHPWMTAVAGGDPAADSVPADPRDADAIIAGAEASLEPMPDAWASPEPEVAPADIAPDPAPGWGATTVAVGVAVADDAAAEEVISEVPELPADPFAMALPADDETPPPDGPDAVPPPDDGLPIPTETSGTDDAVPPPDDEPVTDAGARDAEPVVTAGPEIPIAVAAGGPVFTTTATGTPLASWPRIESTDHDELLRNELFPVVVSGIVVSVERRASPIDPERQERRVVTLRGRDPERVEVVLTDALAAELLDGPSGPRIVPGARLTAVGMPRRIFRGVTLDLLGAYPVVVEGGPVLADPARVEPDVAVAIVDPEPAPAVSAPSTEEPFSDGWGVEEPDPSTDASIAPIIPEARSAEGSAAESEAPIDAPAPAPSPAPDPAPPIAPTDITVPDAVPDAPVALPDPTIVSAGVPPLVLDCPVCSARFRTAIGLRWHREATPGCRPD